MNGWCKQTLFNTNMKIYVKPDQSRKYMNNVGLQQIFIWYLLSFPSWNFVRSVLNNFELRYFCHLLVLAFNNVDIFMIYTFVLESQAPLLFYVAYYLEKRTRSIDFSTKETNRRYLGTIVYYVVERSLLIWGKEELLTHWHQPWGTSRSPTELQFLASNL